MDGLQWLDAIRQDARFGVRMLVKYRGMTLVGAFAMVAVVLALPNSKKNSRSWRGRGERYGDLSRSSTSATRRSSSSAKDDW